jgi:Na+-translocating ferredoxin:NAD+ oxidoreductase subunit B
MDPRLADAIDALLPQTQCTKCGYAGCRPYAEAIAADAADIDQCPPGGTEGVRRLAGVLGRAPKPLNPKYGIEQPRAAALIDEARCIGCMLCIQACPTDAIVGAAKRMHTVLTEACSGCGLCLPPCPVDCIDMVELTDLAGRGSAHAATLSRLSVADAAPGFRARHALHGVRRVREAEERAQRLAGKAQAHLRELEEAPSPDNERKQAVVRAAIERARARRAATGGKS